MCRIGLSWVAYGVLFCGLFASLGGETATTGPATEKRFPPLQVPPGFKATLFACDPLIEYPSAIALGPRPGSLYVAVDYMTGLGTEIVRRDEIRLIEDTNGDGYADKATVFAAGFNSIEGLTYYNGAVYVMHAPFLTVLRDTNGDGLADQRRDLLCGLGLKPEDNPVRLHCANGLVGGHDGWLYLALGDHGCNVSRPEGDHLVLEGGGILRCRPDGRDLHVFASGLRNIYDVALDEDLNVFVRDNENDGGDYKIRVCHSFFGADHGYPYLYHERPAEALPPLADLGLGSSAGGLCYLESQFPADFRGNLFFCEWGRAVVRYQPQRAGAGFAPLKELTFAAGADDDPYGFKPTDLVVDHDGSLMVADWADGQRPRRGRARIYRISHSHGAGRPHHAALDSDKMDLAQAVSSLDADSYYRRCRAQQTIARAGAPGLEAIRQALKQNTLGVRGRLHAVWLIAQAGVDATGELFDIANTDPSPRVQVQAVRALADLHDPVFAQHKLSAAPADAALAKSLAALPAGKTPAVKLEIALALGRLHWPGTPAWLKENFKKNDTVLAHAAQQVMRQVRNWPAVLKFLDLPNEEAMHAIALRAIAGRFETAVVDGLIERLTREGDPQRRLDLADALGRVHRKPGPWVYWGYRPPPRPANTVPWERTVAIDKALNQLLADPDRSVRIAVLRRMQREKITPQVSVLKLWLEQEKDAAALAAILESLREQPGDQVRDALTAIVKNAAHTAANRQAALEMLSKEADAARWLELAASVEDGPVLADVLTRVGKQPRAQAVPLLLRHLESPAAEVRAAALTALVAVQAPGARERIQKLLNDRSALVRQAAAVAAGKLKLSAAADDLIKLAADADAGVRRASLEALGALRERRALPLFVTALGDRQTELIALAGVADLGGSDHAAAVVDLARRSPASDVLLKAARTLNSWNTKDLPAATRRRLTHALAEIHGSHGMLLCWHVSGGVNSKVLPLQILLNPEQCLNETNVLLSAIVADARAALGSADHSPADARWYGFTDVFVPQGTPVQFLASSSGELEVWLNGRSLYRRPSAASFQPDSDRFSGELTKGLNRLAVSVKAARGPVEFQLRFRRRSASADHERLAQAALARPGDLQRGRKLFLDIEKSQCLKCHRLGDQGERIGPELTGVGGRFSRIYLVESILEPSRTIASSFQTWAVTLKNGRMLGGVKVAETESMLTLADNQGQKHVLAKSEIDEQAPQPLSTMPDGLEKRFSLEEFVDLVAFLVSQKEPR